MPRYIDADALGIGKANREIFDNKAYADGWNAAIDIIVSAPTADVQEVRHGKWKFDRFDNAWCSVCHHCGSNDAEVSDYCPNCGAKMDLEESDEKRI